MKDFDFLKAVMREALAESPFDLLVMETVIPVQRRGGGSQDNKG